ncbi:hypothetical protein FB381_0503 [Nocardioides albertanoniae]|uniref:Uncharacterized protein n=1 Tax=Nocardioides albertanoniae TaxID=1175486 RepID=A0A543A220_9ACTN|nr:hypothetical protein [Nocardioides albertanoniae]TQL66639.1 hypothetical protein FB381_0503 [Nocardioides albertanoniae]
MVILLGQYVAKASPQDVEDRLTDWAQTQEAFTDLATDLDLAAKRVTEAFPETSATAQAAQHAFRTAAEKLTNKAEQLDAAIVALREARSETTRAQETHKRIEQSLSFTALSAPDPSSDKYAASGVGVDAAQGVENQKALKADRAAYNAQQASIAEAEAAAAKQIQQVDEQNYTSQPPVRALTDEPGSPNDPAPQPPSSPGSYSDVQAARARMAGYNSGTLYPGGVGHELIAQEKANIEAYEAENKPEWNGNQWVNADGSAAPATSYAMVETADGLAPLAGGTGGMTALAVGGGGALLGAGVAKALASKFAAGGTAKAATAGGAQRSAAARSASAKAGAAGARASGAASRAAGAGARGAGAGARGTGARGAGAGSRGATGAGSRAGRGGAGAGAGRGGRKKDSRQNGQDQDWQADYTDDWTETASDVLDPNASRGWVPDPPQGDGSGDGKSQTRGS